MTSSIASGLLQGIQNPAQADVAGQFRAGQQRRQGREFNTEAQAIWEGMPGAKIANLMKLDPTKATAFAEAIGIPLGQDARIKSAMGGVVMASQMLESGVDPVAVAGFMEDQRKVMEQAGADTKFLQKGIADLSSGNEELILAQGDGLLQLANSFRETGSGRGKFIGTPVRVERDGKTFLTGIQQTAGGKFERVDVPLDGELVSTIGETGEDLSTRLVSQAGDIAQTRADVALATEPGIGAAVVEAEGAAALPVAERKQIQTQNLGRLSELKKGIKTRSSATKKAGQFLRALEKGEAQSGASRTAAGFIPGVFSSQAEFDELFNAFAEVAARQKLKSAGETRPTDADVEGMKRAIFGVGRDEAVNIQLLQEFISDQRDLDDELDELIDAKATKGGLGGFTPRPPKVEDLSGLSKKALLTF